MSFLIILSAPSGGGKTTIARALITARADVGYSVSATTREPRDGEADGTDYHFLTEAEFLKRRENGDFLECARYGQAWYGTLTDEVDRVLAADRHVVLDIEVQGAAQVRQRRHDVVSIFILPPSAATLVERLGVRKTETRGDLVGRLRVAVAELREAAKYDYIVVNEDKVQAVSEVASIIDAEARRVVRAKDLAKTIEQLGRDLEIEADRLTSK